MKKSRLLFSFLFIIALNFNGFAQEEVPKELLLSGLNSVSHLKLENEQITQVMEYNKGFVDDVYDVLESENTDKYKKKTIKTLGEQREIDIREFLGRHKTNKYLKLMEDELRPLGRRNHLLKPIIKS